MPQADEEADEIAKVATIAVVVVTVVANLTLVLMGLLDNGWRALLYGFVIIPLVNLIIVAVAVVKANGLTRGSKGWGTAYSVAAFFMPMCTGALAIWCLLHFARGC